jgi:hypothetical protein
MAMPTVKVKIGADTDELNQGLAKATRNMRSFATGAAKNLAKGALAVGAAAAVAGTALLAFGRAQANVIDKNMKLARSLGLTHNEFIAMSQVANEAGVSTEKLSGMLGIMQRNIIELGKGTQVQSDAFGRLGVSMEDMEGKSPADQFAIIADQLNKIGDPATRTATAMDVLGRSGRGAINMLDGYSQKVADAAAFQEKFGLAVSDFDAQSIENANDAFGRVWEAMKGLGRIIATYVAPLVTYLSKKFLESGISADSFRKFGERAMGIVGAGIDLVRVGIIRMNLGFQIAKESILNFAATGVRALKPLAEAMDYVNNRFGGSLELTSSIMGQADAFDASAAAAAEAANSYRDQLANFEGFADAIKRVRDSVLAEQAAGGITAPSMEGGDDAAAPGALPGGIGGAGKVTEDMQIRLEALRESLLTEQEEVDAWYMRSLEALDWYDAQRTARQATSTEDRLRLEQEYRDKVDALTVRGAEREKKSTQEAASAALSSLSTVFKKSKGIRVAMAIMDTYAGATRALKDYAAPYSYAVAASVVAAGLANVASIMSASSSGGSGGGGGGGAAAAGAAPAAEAPTTTFQFNLRGDSGGFGESMLRDLVEQINSTQRNGGRFIGVIA